MMVLAADLLAVAVACGDAATPFPTSIETDTPVITPSPTLGVTDVPVTVVPSLMRVVRVDEVAFPVDLAVTAAERIQGLSGRLFLDSGTGMLFVFEAESRLSFWMKEMKFPLDMVWIGAGCQVVDISENVPYPDPETSLSDLPRYSPDIPALYVLEINGGESAALGLVPGDPVAFVGALAGEYGC